MAKAGEFIWRDIGSITDYEQEKCYRLYAEIGEDHDVVLFKYQGLFYALQNSCQHMGGPLSGTVDIEDIGGQATIACPWHGYKYDIKTGRSLVFAELKQQTFEVMLDRTQVYVKHKYRLKLTPWPPLTIG